MVASIVYTDEKFGARESRGIDRVYSLAKGLDVRGQSLIFEQNGDIFAQEDAAGTIYQVVSGVVRATRLMDDGRRHIVAFYFPGDVFGIEAGALRTFNAEAVTRCQIISFRRSDVADEMARSGFSGLDLWRLMVGEIERFQQHSFLLSRLSAVERVWSFLKMMAAGRPRDSVIDLPMSRTDIADFLGLTIETVSRAFTQLRKDGAIEILCARRIRIVQVRGRSIAA